MTQKIVLHILFCFGFLGFSQEKTVDGKVIVNASLQGIKVENINREISVYTDENGDFRIIANEGEVLIFSSVSTEKKILFLQEEHFENPIEVSLKTTEIEIEEVEVGKQIDLDLGGKKLTQAEREYEAGGRILTMNQGLDINLEAVGNLFSGKRKELKNAVELEKINKLAYELDTYFDEDFYVNGLGLEPEYIVDFKYFLVEDKSFRAVLESENESEIIMKTIKMYESYQKIKADED